MFKRITSPQELEPVVTFLNREPQINHFLLGNMELSPLDDANLGVWAERLQPLDADGSDTDQPLAAVLVRWYGNFLLYAPGGADWEHAAQIMNQYGYGALSGKPEYIHPLLQHLSAPARLETHVFMALDPGELRPPQAQAPVIRVDTDNLEQYLPGIIALRRSITEFHSALNVEAMREEVAAGSRHVALIVQDGLVASMAMTAERDSAAMIVSVCTAQAYRGRGYAGIVTSALCADMARAGKQALLFYCNPSAGRIYSALGFRDIGRWCMVSF